MAYWLVKSEPNTWSWDDQVRAGSTEWDGVRNHQANNNMKAMRKGDRVFFYHSGESREIVGIVSVAHEWYPDPADASGKFGMVDVKRDKALQTPVTLAAIKAEPRLQDILLVRHTRLSVMPIPDAAWKLICRMGGVTP
jgi:predicted RNA-binding protein with PUA-like domain